MKLHILGKNKKDKGGQLETLTKLILANQGYTCSHGDCPPVSVTTTLQSRYTDSRMMCIENPALCR